MRGEGSMHSAQPGPGIHSVSLVVTEECNFRCAYCYQEAHRGHRMSRTVADHAIDAIREACRTRTPLVHFYGGEPLLNWHLMVYLVPALQSVGVNAFSVTTNASCIDDNIARFLREQNFRVLVSFDGHPEAQELRQSGSYARVVPSIHRLLSAFADCPSRVCVHAVVTAANVHHLVDSIRELVRIGFRRITLSPEFNPRTPWSADSICTLNLEFDRLAAWAQQHYRRAGWTPLTKLDCNTPPKPRTEARGCSLVTGSSFAVCPDGRLYTCLAVPFARLEPTLWDSLCVGSVDNGFPNSRVSGNKCLSCLEDVRAALGVQTEERGRMADAHGCPLSLLTASCSAELRHLVTWREAESRYIAAIPKRRRIIGIAPEELFSRTWGSLSSAGG
jgi:sulfatase maturation enzyme AslB (radical SAM superfamily)